MPYVYLIVIMHGLVEEVTRFTRDQVVLAERAFVDAMEARLSNFEDYTHDDIQACLEDGYEGFGGGDCSIQLHWGDT